MTKSSSSATATRSRIVIHNYHDNAQVPFSSDIEDKERKSKPSGGIAVAFPLKLHVMLSEVEDDGLSHIVSWQPHGRSFLVHKPKAFVEQIMPLYFRQSKITSFQRQLNLYGFSRITAGKDRGGYYHELFLRHRLFLCQRMPRIRIKGNGIKAKASPETEPNFYSMLSVKPGDAVFEAANRDLARSVVVAMKEENKRFEPIKKQSTKRQDVATTKKQKNTTKTRFRRGGDCYSPPAQRKSLVNMPPAVVTPDTIHSKKKLEFPKKLEIPLDIPSMDISSSTARHKLQLQRRPSHYSHSSSSVVENILFAPLPSACSDDTGGLPSDDDVSLDEEFHHLDMFDFNFPELKNNSYPMPRLESSFSESSLSVVQTLREPILTPSTSSSSLNEMLQQGETIEIDTIFT